ncbi:unnamed protein product [Boreogadus saida]
MTQGYFFDGSAPDTDYYCSIWNSAVAFGRRRSREGENSACRGVNDSFTVGIKPRSLGRHGGCNNHINPSDEPAKRADGLPGSTLGLKWDPSHCGPLGVCVDRAAPSAPRRGPTSAHAHLARLAREGQRGQRSQDSQGIHTSWRSHLPLLPP